MGRSRIKGMLISVSSTVVLLALAELALRLFTDSGNQFIDNGDPNAADQPDQRMDVRKHVRVHCRSKIPGLFYELKPGSSVVIDDAPNAISSLGMRDREVARQKADGIFRIAVVGDSLTYGWRVAIEDCYVKKLEDLLNQHSAGGRGDSSPGRRIEVLNFGVSGYNTEQELIVLKEKVLGFEPDLVIVGFVPNDILFSTSVEAIVFAERDRAFGRQALEAERLLDEYTPRKAEQALPQWISWSKLVCVVWQRIENARKGDFLVSYYRNSERWSALKNALRNIKTLLDENGIPVFVALIPEDYRIVFNKTREEVHEKLIAALTELGFPHIDLVHAYDGESVGDLIINDQDPHPNALGHAIAAQAIHQALVAEELVPRQ